jgi:3-hydroxyacyl-CoA dehydrogenase/enoyl-CoA hydratase/3-hydroxybutyryl-CoA epimerase
MSKFFRYEENNQLSIITFDSTVAEVNCWSEGAIAEFDEMLGRVESSKSKGLVIISGKKDQFIVGADINEFARFQTAEDAEKGATVLGTVFDRLADLKIPSVAAIHGSCLGGGLEMALACSWRIMTEHAKSEVGLPEILLGLLPGAGGTQRMPRLIGIQTALDLILTGKSLNSKKASRIGLVDRVCPEHLLMTIASEYALKPKSSRPQTAVNFTNWALEKNFLGRSLIRKKAKEMVDKNTKGFFPAPYKALDAIFDGYEKKLGDGLKLERQLFGQLYATRECKSMIHLFHATTHAKKNPYKDALNKRFGEEKAKTVGMIGAGLMGMGIATVCADKGLNVYVSDPSKQALGRGLNNARKFYDKKVQRKSIKKFEQESRMMRISPGLSVAGFQNCNVVIEAVFEDLRLKQKILGDVANSSRGDWIFASNTSALPIREIAKDSPHKDRILGMHFFSPVEKMPLVEIIVTPDTADWAAGRVFEIGAAMGKKVIVVKDGPGFYTTRALAFYLAEATALMADGAHIESVDRALTDFGFPVGPIKLVDEVGIDVASHVLRTMVESFSDRIYMPPAMKKILDSGRLGKKNSKGFYLYRDGKTGGPDSEIYSYFDVKSGSTPAAADIVERCLLVFIAESIRCLEEGILNHAHDGDVGAIFGLGFPPAWGGPFKYVDHIGVAEVCKRLEALESQHGKRFSPPALLKKMAAGNEKFFPTEATA